jgi:hypothetical protein
MHSGNQAFRKPGIQEARHSGKQVFGKPSIQEARNRIEYHNIYSCSYAFKKLGI